MPISSGIPSTLLERRSENYKPTLTPAIQKKIALLPGLRRRQLLEQRELLKQTVRLGRDSAETDVQSLGHVAEPELSTSHMSKNFKPAITTRYTISGGVPHAVTTTTFSQAGTVPTMSQPPLVRVDARPCLQSSSPIIVTDFSTHHGETAVMRPPIVGDDLKSRLEGLRQFKDWSEQIHGSPQQQTQLAPEVIPHHYEIPTNPTITVGKNRPAEVAGRECLDHIEDKHLNDKLRASEGSIVTLTPFCSPQATAISFIAARGDQKRCSTLRPTLDLPEKLLQGMVAYARPTAHSKTMVISSDTPSAQIAKTSIMGSPRDLHKTPIRRANSKSKSHPPISFPRDFYDRFPNAECHSSQAIEQQFHSGARTTSVASAGTPSAGTSEENAVPEDNDPLTTSDRTRDAPDFYAMVHCFTDCPHSSPPASRPLDAKGQPMLDPNFKPTKYQTTRSIILGACFDCDLAYRRDEEDNIMNSFTAQLAELAEELAEALNEIELDDSDDDEAGPVHDKHSARFLATSRFTEDKHDLDLEIEGIMDLPPLSDDPDVIITPRSGRLQTAEKKSHMNRVVSRIRELEVQIQHVRDEQEEQIKRVWLGFTPRWGPATLGVQRGRVTSTDRAALTDDERAGGRYQGGTAAEVASFHGSQAVGLGATSPENDDANQVKSESSSSSCDISRSRSGGFSRSRSSSRSRSRGATPSEINSVVSPRDVPGSRTPGKGKMKIGRIREEKS